MQSKKRLRVSSLAGILCLLVMLLAACGGPANNTAGNNFTAASADKQILRQPEEGGDFDSLDPALTFAGLGDPYNLIFSGLVALTDSGTVVDQLAQSHQISPDGLTYTFTLRSGLKFSDGAPLTADDVAYSLNRVLLPATKSSVTNYLDLLKDYDKVTAGTIPTLIGDSIIVKDPTTISLVISKKAAYFLEALTYSTGDIVQKKLIDQYGAKWVDHLEEGAGSGPFKVQSYGHTSSLVLVPNPNYYAFKPKIQQIIYTIASDRDSNYKSYQAGQYDLAPVPPALDPIAKTKPGFQLVPALAARYIGLNYLVKPLDNIKIRQALDLAINKDLIIGRVIGPIVTPSNHIVPDGIPGYNAKLTGPGGVTGTAGDQAKAKALFLQGLQEEGYSGVSQFPTLTINYSVSNQAGANVVNAIVAEWKQILGITIKAVGEQADQLIQDENTNFGSKKLQLWYGGWSADYPDPQDWLTLFFGKNASHNGFNYGQNTSSAATEQQSVQTSLAQADTEQDPAARIKLYQDAEQKIVNDVAWITLYQSSYIYSVNPKLQNWKLNSLGSIATSDWANIYFAQ